MGGKARGEKVCARKLQKFDMWVESSRATALLAEAVDELHFRVPVGEKPKSGKRKSFKMLLGWEVGLMKVVFEGENRVT